MLGFRSDSAFAMGMYDINSLDQESTPSSVFSVVNTLHVK